MNRLLPSLVAVLAGCGHGPAAPDAAPPDAAPPDAAPPDAAPRPDAWVIGEPGPPIGRFEITYYWVAEEVDEEIPFFPIFDRECVPLAIVSIEFARRLAMEGTGLLLDGRLLNFDSRCICSWMACFAVAEPIYPWGIGVEGRPLVPFRSVAVDPTVVKNGGRLYVPALDGLLMPGEPPWGGFAHDGCVSADDRGSAILDLQLDFFVGKKAVYREVQDAIGAGRTHVLEGGRRCPPLGGPPPRGE